MACKICSNNPNNECIFSFDAALDGIRKHFNIMETKLLEQDKTIVTLKEYNERLLKAVSLSKKPNFNTQIFQPVKATRSNCSSFNNHSAFDVAFVDIGDDDDNDLQSEKNDTLNVTDWIATESEIITETEIPKTSFLSRAKKKKSQISNAERKAYEVASPHVIPDLNSNIEKRSTLDRLNPVNNSNAAQIKNTKSMLSLSLNKPKYSAQKNSKALEDVNSSDLNQSTTFCFTDTMLEKNNNTMDGETESFLNYSNNDTSVIAIPTPRQDPICLDDTLEVNQIDRTDKKAKKFFALKSKENFALNPILTINKTTNKMHSPDIPIKIKNEPNTQQFQFKPKNPLFAQTECVDNLNDTLTQTIKPEPMETSFNDEHCEYCRNYIKIGNRIRRNSFDRNKCKCGHNEDDYDKFVQQTPDGFWNPLFETFDENDPRNEVLIDNRFVEDKKRKYQLP